MSAPAAVTRPGQLAALHLASFTARAPLLLDCPEPALAAALDARPAAAPCTVFLRDRAAWKSFAGTATAAAFGAWLEPPAAPFDGALVFLPKSRDLVSLTLEMTAAAVAPGAPVWLVGANTAGIRSADDDLARWVGPVGRVETGRHCALLMAVRTVSAGPPQPLAARAVRFNVTALRREVAVVSLPGVFSHGALDDGTRLLLGTLAPEKAGRILDFGCGCGVIGAALRLATPEAELTCLDAGALALEATRLTLEANGLPADRLLASDGLDEAEGPYDLIVSNPPFHTGVETDRGIAERFVKDAPSHLRRGGRLRLVANTFLRYKPLMEEVFKQVRVVAEDGRYQVLEAKRK